MFYCKRMCQGKGIKIGRYCRTKESRKAIFVLILGIILVIGLPGYSTNKEPKRKVVIFVLDSFFEDEENHGDMVSRVIRKNCPGECRIEKRDVYIKTGRRENRYLKELKEILQYMKNHPDVGVVINISLGNYTYNMEEHLIIKELYNKGAVIVAAAGNDNTSRKQYPAAYEEVVAVAAIDSTGKKEKYSNYGNYIYLAAEGFGGTKINIESKMSGIYVEEETTCLIHGGTSFAAPRVTALIAEILQRRPDLSNAAIIKLIKGTADPTVSYELDSQNKSVHTIKLGKINPVKALCAADPSYRRGYELKQTILSKGLIGLLVFIAALLIFIPIGLKRAIKKDKDIAVLVYRITEAEQELEKIEQERTKLLTISKTFSTLRFDKELTSLDKAEQMHRETMKTAKSQLRLLGVEQHKIELL